MDMSMGNNNQKQTTTYDQNRPKYDIMTNNRRTSYVKSNHVYWHRKHVGTINDYLEMKDIKNFKIIRMRTKRDHSVLEPYEKQFNKPLGILDAIVISPLTKYEIKEIIDTYDTNEELLAYQNAENERTLQYYHENYEQD